VSEPAPPERASPAQASSFPWFTIGSAMTVFGMGHLFLAIPAIFVFPMFLLLSGVGTLLLVAAASLF
jgi:hypothetical protein